MLATLTLDSSQDNLLLDSADEETDPEEFDVAVTVAGNGCETSQTSQNGVYQLHEGHGSVLDFPGSLADPYSSDYLTVTLPALRAWDSC